MHSTLVYSVTQYNTIIPLHLTLPHMRTGSSVISIRNVHESFGRQHFFPITIMLPCSFVWTSVAVNRNKTVLNVPIKICTTCFLNSSYKSETAHGKQSVTIAPTVNHVSFWTCMRFQHNQQQTLFTTSTDKTKTDKILNIHLPHTTQLWLINKKYYLHI